jgi:hypothetical protein
VTRLLAALVALACGASCAATPTTLTVHAILPDGQPLGAAYFEVTLTGPARSARLLYARPEVDGGERDQSFVVILADATAHQTFQVLVEARQAQSLVDGGAEIDAGLDPSPGEPIGTIVASGSGEITIAGDRDNLLIVPLTRL